MVRTMMMKNRAGDQDEVEGVQSKLRDREAEVNG